MMDVLAEPEAARKLDRNAPLYFMHRGIALKGDLRYDITILAPGSVGNEFNKTLGHYHSSSPLTNKPYAELYEVLHGEADYLIQKKDAKTGKIVDVQLMHAKAGQKVLMPSGYGHVTVNKSKYTLVMANVVSDGCVADYDEYRRTRGAAYYVTKNGTVPNKNYGKIPKLKRSKPAKIDLPKGKSLYEILMREPEKFSFLL